MKYLFFVLLLLGMAPGKSLSAYAMMDAGCGDAQDTSKVHQPPVPILGATTLLPDLKDDTALSRIMRELSPDLQNDFLKGYIQADPEQRKMAIACLDAMWRLPQCSKEQLVQNMLFNRTAIFALRDYFRRIIGPSLRVYIEFKPAATDRGASVDFWLDRIDARTGELSNVFRQWDIPTPSAQLDQLLQQASLDRKVLASLQRYMNKADCISIENSSAHIISVGYGRSGMGKYGYLLFEKPLSKKEQEAYNNKCSYIFYKDNIVLEYSGGAMGPQCFPDPG